MPKLPHPKSLTVVLTGVTRGLGRAMAEEFIHLGHQVIGCARTKERIRELNRIFPNHDFQVVNVASNVQVRAWARRILAKYPPPDFLINNAAVLNAKAPLWKVGDREFQDVVATNLVGVMHMIRHFTPSMMRRRRGVIINFASRWALKFESNMGPYCATKLAVVAITDVLAAELRSKKIAVVAVNPGIVRTEMLRQYLGHDPGREPLRSASWTRDAHHV